MRYRSHYRGNHALLADAGLAGLLFWLPTLLVGTPIIEFRTMLLLGFTLALPFLAPKLATKLVPKLAPKLANHAGISTSKQHVVT